MKPPICAVCGKRFSPGKGEDGGTTVKFADYAPLPERRVGHPKGMVWVCSEHLEGARSHANLTTAEAIKKIREET
ncbi:MAG: hypothetical protein AAGM27_07490 [Cyanobacteria bacterium J06554_3]